MITTPLLEEKYESQRKLGEKAGHDILQYFELSHKIVTDISLKHGYRFKYGKIHGGEIEPVLKQKTA